jgi:hypothetical protein
VKLKLTICARAGNRAGLFCVRDPDAQPGETQMTFVKGQSRNPAGRPPGSRNKATILAVMRPGLAPPHARRLFFSCYLQA